MRAMGIELVKPTLIDVVFGFGLILLISAVGYGTVGPSAIGALSGGVVSAIFGVRAYRSITEFLAAGCCGAIGALLCSALTVAVSTGNW